MTGSELKRNLYLVAILGQGVLIWYTLTDISFSLHTVAEQMKISADSPQCEWVAAEMRKQDKCNGNARLGLDGNGMARRGMTGDKSTSTTKKEN